ncbi:HD domain-containing protein [Proteinivorax tanatarense]|uniref:HD domain-containing protein n=1 Tax=Proteinivorax tanatarense TaxID=1260629 RepID=A0AAU7VJT4_9FIRM
MKRINNILTHDGYITYLNKIRDAEKNRPFCKHGLQHFFDVARIGYIFVLERNLSIDKETIYAAALLHDIGRWREYKDGTDHALVSGDIAKEILRDCKFGEKEIKHIVQAIKLHRNKNKLYTQLDKVLYESDKVSRPCISCGSRDKCKRFANGEKVKFFV